MWQTNAPTVQNIELLKFKKHKYIKEKSWSQDSLKVYNFLLIKPVD